MPCVATLLRTADDSAGLAAGFSARVAEPGSGRSAVGRRSAARQPNQVPTFRYPQLATSPAASRRVIHNLPRSPHRGVRGRDAHLVTALPDWLDEFVPLPDPTELPRVLTRSEAHARGYTDAKITYRVRAGHWRRMTAGVYLTVPDARTDDHCSSRSGTAAPGPSSPAQRLWLRTA